MVVATRCSGKAALRVLATIAVAGGILAHPPGSTVQSARAEPNLILDPQSQSVLRLSATETLPAVRRAAIGLGKSLLIELPSDAQDIMVSQPVVLDAVVLRPRRVYLLAKDVGETNVFFNGKDGQRLMVLEVTVARSYTELKETLARLLPGSRIGVTATGDGIALSGTVAHPIDATRAAEIANQYVKKGGTVVNLISASAREQILLKVTVAEMQREAIRRLGVNLPEAVAHAGSVTFSKVVENAFSASGGVVPAAAFAATGGVPLVTAGTAAQASAQWNGNRVSAMVQALERAGLSRTLAEPNLTAISGETAKFLAGGEFPVPVAVNNNTITITWKSFGVGVSFTPFVLSEGRISLKVAAEVSELTSDGAVTSAALSIPGLRVRRAETTVELPSGGSLAMAGLLSDQTRQGVEGMPALKDLPVLGALFRSKDYRRNETELVILVTPYTVNPTERQELSRPDKGFAPPSDLHGLFLGHLNRVYGEPVPLPARPHLENSGFIIEYPDDGAAG